MFLFCAQNDKKNILIISKNINVKYDQLNHHTNNSKNLITFLYKLQL